MADGSHVSRGIRLSELAERLSLELHGDGSLEIARGFAERDRRVHVFAA